MTGIDRSLQEIKQLNTLQQRSNYVNRLHPLVKLLLSLVYIIIVVSVSKYGLGLVLAMAVYPFLAFSIADLRLRDALYRLRLILPLVLCIGIFNPIFDRAPYTQIGQIVISCGTVSMLTLMGKGLETVLAAYLLIATTTIEDICYALQLLHVPKILIMVILLINRYLSVLGEEGAKIITAYRLRAPRQNGISYKAWGPLVGQWLMRSMDRAQNLYESMALRGFRGEFSSSGIHRSLKESLPYLLAWTAVLAVLRFTPLITLLGSLF